MVAMSKDTFGANATHCIQLFKEPIMGSTTDKIKGAANQAAGAIKQGVGEAVGNPSLEIEGAAQKLKGQAQETVGEAKDAVKKLVDKA
jgi:uncharacterized protein YjbJ (UPF0337 family)